MRLLLAILAIALIAGITQWVLVIWWSAPVVAGIVGLFYRLRTGEAFLAGFWGIALLWLAFVTWLDMGNNHILSRKMAEVLHLPSYLAYIILTFILGGLVGGFPAWAGAHLRVMFQKR